MTWLDYFRKALVRTERGPAIDLSAQAGQPVAPPGIGENWFGPLPPMRPVATPEVAGRAFDYTPGYNLQTQPRADEPVDFVTLRALADAYDPLRLIIERRKDQVGRLPWTVRAKHDGVGR